MQSGLRHDWRTDEIRAIHDQPLLALVFQAASVHRANQTPDEMQVCKLINIKTGACPEDCGYCSQSAHWQTGVEPQALMDKAVVVDIARKALQNGVSRVCMGAAWRDVRDGVQFDRVLDIVRDVSAMGVEVCCTLGMLTPDQAKRLEEAGLYAYNHNLDSSRAHYDKVVTTRTYDDRLRTIDAVRTTNVTVCTGGIMGLGETTDDRIELLRTLATLTPHPESVPVNILANDELPAGATVGAPVIESGRGVLGDFFHEKFEVNVIDGAVNGLGKLTVWTSSQLRKIQTGNIGFYVLSMVIGIVLLLIYGLSKMNLF